MSNDTLEKVKTLEAEKVQMINRYLALQDEADEMNGRIYDLCCEIEALNKKIVIAKEDAEREAQKHALKKPPTNGNGHAS